MRRAEDNAVMGSKVTSVQKQQRTSSKYSFSSHPHSAEPRIETYVSNTALMFERGLPCYSRSTLEMESTQKVCSIMEHYAI